MMKVRGGVGMLLLLVGCTAAPPGPSPAPAASPSASASIAPNSGRVTTLASRGYLLDLTTDADGNLYLLSTTALRKRAPDGQETVIAPVRQVQFPFQDPDLGTGITNPHRLARDRQGNFYVSGPGRLYKLTPDGRLSNLAIPEPVHDRVDGLVVDSHGNLFLTGYASNVVFKVTQDGQVGAFAGRELGNVDDYSHLGAGFLDGFGTEALFRQPLGLAIDAEDNLYVADSNNEAIRKIAPDGQVTTLYGSPRPAPMTRGAIRQVVRDPAGRIYFATLDNRLYRLSADRQAELVAGDGTTCGRALCIDTCPSPTPLGCYRDGQGPAAEFDDIHALAVDPRGALYLAEGPDPTRLRKVE